MTSPGGSEPTPPAPAARAPRIALARIALGVSVVLLAASVFAAARWSGRVAHLRTEAVAAVLFLAALWALAHARLDPRRTVLGVVVVGAVLQVTAVGTAPISSDDVYRYGWDAKVQWAGIDPYRYAPDDPTLDRLRTPTLFPNKVCYWKLRDGGCSRVNRPDVHTIYPPVAEGVFALSRLASLGRTDGTAPMQVFGALGALGIALLLARRARTDGRPAWTVAVWAWCPVTVLEAGNNAHIDWLAALFVIAAMMSLRGRRPVWAGSFLGAAVASKLYPGLLLASLLRRRPVAVVGAAAALVALSYVPHIAAVGTKVIGYLPGYLREENYLDGGRFRLLAIVLPSSWLSPAGALVLLGVGVWAWRRSDPDAPERIAVVVMGVALLVTTPTYAWYALVLLALVALSGRLEWLPLVLLMTVAMTTGPYSLGPLSLPTLCYLISTVAAVAPLLRREARAHRVRRADAIHAPGRAGPGDDGDGPGRPMRSAPRLPATRPRWPPRRPVG